MIKSNSFSNLNNETNNKDTSNQADSTKELKSIMKVSSNNQVNKLESASGGGLVVVEDTDLAKKKRAVRILENIDDKNDQLTNLRIDNRTKHAASTSTPSGQRRRPLKAPVDVSMIGKS